MRMMTRTLPIFISLLLIFSYRAFSQEKPVQLRAAIHLSSTVSEGSYDFDKIAALAKANGISVVVITDRDLLKWEYGLWPLRNLIKKTVEHSSIFTYGIKRYLNGIEALQKKFPEMIFIPGIESAPFYYWQGSAVESAALERQNPAGGIKGLRRRLSGQHKNLKMYDWHRHILTLGLEKYSDYRNLPIIGNPRGLRQEFNVAALWPLVLLIFGLWLWFIKANIYKRQKIIAGVAITIGFIFFCNNWPFAKLKFDQYHDSGSRPYQNYLDYVNERGGLTFWAHPEAEYNLNMAGIDFITAEHSASLAETEDYAGFCVFPEGYRQIGRPKGLWDELLLEYCRGVRKRPVWAIAGLAFEKGTLSQAMRNRQTVILASGRSKKAVLEAIRDGKMYAQEGEHSLDFSLDEFYVTDAGNRVKGIAGDTVEINGNPQLHISGRFANRQESVEVRVIRNGSIFKEYILETPFDIVCPDEQPLESKSYYRLEIVGKGLRFVSNPVFVERK
jgi:hypothetical protein